MFEYDFYLHGFLKKNNLWQKKENIYKDIILLNIHVCKTFPLQNLIRQKTTIYLSFIFLNNGLCRSSFSLSFLWSSLTFLCNFKKGIITVQIISVGRKILGGSAFLKIFSIGGFWSCTYGDLWKHEAVV